MRIGVLCYPTFGGSGVVATELGQGLAARGHEIHLFSYASPARLGGFDERVHLHEIEVSSYPLFRYPPYNVALTSRLAEVAEEAELDLVHAHYAIPHSIAALMVKAILLPRRLPVVTTLHGTDITVVGQEPSYARITRYALRESDAVTAVSDYLKQQTLQQFDGRVAIDVIHNFVDAERFAPARDERIRKCFSPDGAPVLMHISNFRPVKRAAAAVDAFAAVHREIPATLVMVGDGPDRGACEARAQALRVRDRVRFLGAQTEVEHLLPAADIFLLPSEYESFGLAALEAMSCGVVPIAAASGGLPEVIADGETGCLVQPDRPGDMAHDALALLRAPKRLAAMKRAAREVAISRFARHTILDRYEQLYQRVLDGTS